jgi:hypothetical protein
MALCSILPFFATLTRLYCTSLLQTRFAFLSAIANQLRFPNAHTLFFSRLLLGAFVDGAGAASGTVAEAIREQLTRVLLERLIAHRPHPWGLLVTFIELIKSGTYNFWSHGFTRLNTEIEKLFEVRCRYVNVCFWEADVLYLNANVPVLSFRNLIVACVVGR